MVGRCLLAAFIVAASAAGGRAQAVRTVPYNAQLRTDPAVGNVQGIQRYGRPLRTDPDQGEGYSYHVYPVAPDPAVVVASGTQPAAAPAGPGSRSAAEERAFQSLATEDPAHAQLTQAYQKARAGLEVGRAQRQRNAIAEPQLRLLEQAFHTAEANLRQREEALRAQAARVLQSAAAAEPPAGVRVIVPEAPAVPYPPPFDATQGLRYLPPVPPEVVVPPAALSPFARAFPHEVGARALAFNPADPAAPFAIYHQPLIQVRVRVVEVAREDRLQVSSVLDFIGQPFGEPTLIAGNNVNRDFRNVSGGTRFPLPGIVSFTGNNLGTLTGTGALVNLTAGNVNYIARLLATEFRADVVTAPEVVTLNGQNVEFVAGQKLPFELGQNVIQGTNNNIQQFFYKHVGTYISVTPRIVNWGKLSEGGGQAPLTEGEVADWPAFLAMAVGLHGKSITLSPAALAAATSVPPGAVVPLEVKAAVLDDLKKYARCDLAALGLPVAPKAGCGDGCAWRPEDCTIDLTVVVRLSEGGTVTLTPVRSGDPSAQAMTTTAETNVRGIANIVQVKSGHGVVMGGLIGERQIDELSKVPVLGDVPVLGFLFRSKATNRQKTEVLVFIEAQVLDPRPEAARAQSHQDFTLGTPYVAGEFLENPLEYGLYRAGFGTYLPPHSAAEKVFWERLGRKVRKIATTLDDVFE